MATSPAATGGSSVLAENSIQLPSAPRTRLCTARGARFRSPAAARCAVRAWTSDPLARCADGRRASQLYADGVAVTVWPSAVTSRVPGASGNTPAPSGPPVQAVRATPADGPTRPPPASPAPAADRGAPPPPD